MKNPAAVRAAIGFALYILLVPALLFIAAGTLNWPMAWVYVILLLVATLGSRLIVWQRNPDLLRERARLTQSEGTQSWDRILVPIVGLFGPMAMVIVAGLDYRFDWSEPIPKIVQILAALALAASYGLAVWAMVANAYFSAVVRIQQDRGQVVVTTGPYRFVRHPAYAGSVVASLAFPFMLNTLWAMLPAVLMVIALVIRTHLEDAMLRTELDGYAAYAAQTRYRLIPGLW